MTFRVLPKNLSEKKAPVETNDDEAAPRDDQGEKYQEAASVSSCSAQHDDVHTNGAETNNDEAAPRDDQGEKDQEAASVSSSSAQHDDDSAPMTPKLNYDEEKVLRGILSSPPEKNSELEEESLNNEEWSFVFEKNQEYEIFFEKEQEECEDQEKVRLESSLPANSDREESSNEEESSSSNTSVDILPLSNGDDRRGKETNKDTIGTQQAGDSSDQDDQDKSEETKDKDDTRIWKFRLFCGKVVNNEHVQIAIISLIIINALIMGLATFDFVTDDPHVKDIFEKTDRSFLVLFTIEITMQFCYLGFTLFTDGWLAFDFFIVILSWSFESLQIVRAFRVFRAFRLFTRIKPLRDLVLAIGAVLPRVYAIGALLLLIFYIFSVLFTELFKDLPLSENYFGTLDASLFTCMELMTLEWSSIVREVMVYRLWAWAPFLAFILLTGFIVFNLIVAVVCDAVAVTEKTVRELDGIESDNPYVKIDQAQERIDLLQCHIEDMLRTQQAVQDMLEIMAGEFLHLEVERMKSEQRGVELRIELDRRKDFEKSMESTLQVEGLQRTKNEEKDRRAQQLELNGGLSSPRHSRRSVMRGINSRPGSERSLGTRSRNSRISSSDRSLGAISPRRDRSGNDSHTSLLSDF
jgi:hypothetical protein